MVVTSVNNNSNSNNNNNDNNSNNNNNNNNNVSAHAMEHTSCNDDVEDEDDDAMRETSYRFLWPTHADVKVMLKQRTDNPHTHTQTNPHPLDNAAIFTPMQCTLGHTSIS